MTFRNHPPGGVRVKTPAVLMLIGMLCLAAAIVSLTARRRMAGVGPNAIDAINGGMFGIAIGFNLWALRLRKQRRRLGAR